MAPFLRLLLFLLLLSGQASAAATWVRSRPEPGDFPLATEGQAATLVLSPADHKVVSLAARDLADDIKRVTGIRPATTATLLPAAGGPIVLIGTLGRHPLIDRLVSEGRLEIGDLAGAWESFVIATVATPFPGVPQALVVAGSDRRGTAFGAYELSQAIGVSPWHWWADVGPERQEALHVASGLRRFGPPSVKYRGFFINDEDWGLQPWAARTFEPEHGDIGPKTYAKVFELLLRLKANTLWPAMHACTAPFNADPRHAALADDYAIVMGSSHAEPMLRNNVREWTAPHPDYNYVTNREGVRAYWEERVRTNGRYENLYTLGMRGIHDSAIQGATTDAERIAVLEQVFADQRDMLARHVRPDVERLPQMFCAYKEVLDLYRQGLRVPDDVTIVWPDDNFGYIRSFASPEERGRSGGFGVYYHISYLGRPLAYLWLNTTPPALIWSEMRKAFDHGADRIWILNVGDIKPAEIGIEFFLQLAWDIDRWHAGNLPDFLREWAAREFGTEHAAGIAGLMDDFFRLNYQRKPEHLQWWLPNQPPRPSPLTPAERSERLAAFARLTAAVDALVPELPERLHDAFFELVAYPVQGAALANQRYFAGEAGDATAALAVDAALRDLTARFGEIAGGKWRDFMRLEPADDDWRSMRIAAWKMPEFPPQVDASAGDDGVVIAREAGDFTRSIAGSDAAWTVIPGLGHTGRAITPLPFAAADIPLAEATRRAPRVEYDLIFPTSGRFTLRFHLAPTHPLVSGRGLRFAIALGDAAPQEVVVPVEDGSPAWAQGVLNNALTGTVSLEVPSAGSHCLKIFMIAAGAVLDKFVINGGDPTPSGLGPPETP